MHDPRVLLFDLRWIEIWHDEPDGKDSGTVCRREDRWRHIGHWRLNSMPLRALRRRLLTRCEWCSGCSTPKDPVNCSRGPGRPKTKWWRGEAGLLHRDCLSVERSHILCYCEVPVLDHGDHGQCLVCEGRRAWRRLPTAADRLLKTLPHGARIDAGIRPQVERLWAEARR